MLCTWCYYYCFALYGVGGGGGKNTKVGVLSLVSMSSFSFTEFVLTVQGMEPGKLTRELKQYKIMYIQYVEPCSGCQIFSSSIFTLAWGRRGGVEEIGWD